MDYKAEAEKILTQLDQQLGKQPFVQQIATKAKVRPAFLAVGALLTFVLFIFWGFGQKLVGNLVGFVYPLFASFRVLKRVSAASKEGNTPSEEENEEVSQWLTYWVVYCVFNLIDSATDILTYWIPFYHLVKIAFLVWCFLPATRGALIFFHQVIQPVLVKYEGKIDGVVDKAKKGVTRVKSDLGDEVSQATTGMVRKVAQEAVNAALNDAANKQE